MKKIFILLTILLILTVSGCRKSDYKVIISEEREMK